MIVKALVLFVFLGIFNVLKLLLHFDLESSHGISLELSGIELSSDGKVIRQVVSALDSKDHQHVDLGGLWDVVVAQVDSLERLALCEWPLDRFDIATEVHTAKINVNKL